MDIAEANARIRRSEVALIFTFVPILVNIDTHFPFVPLGTIHLLNAFSPLLGEASLMSAPEWMIAIATNAVIVLIVIGLRSTSSTRRLGALTLTWASTLLGSVALLFVPVGGHVQGLDPGRIVDEVTLITAIPFGIAVAYAARNIVAGWNCVARMRRFTA